MTTDDLRYDLFFVMQHHGPSLRAGHYTCFVLIRSGWVKVNDSTVRPSDIVEVLQCCASLVLYKKLKKTKGKIKGKKTFDEKVYHGQVLETCKGKYLVAFSKDGTMVKELLPVSHLTAPTSRLQTALQEKAAGNNNQHGKPLKICQCDDKACLLNSSRACEFGMNMRCCQKVDNSCVLKGHNFLYKMEMGDDPEVNRRESGDDGIQELETDDELMEMGDDPEVNRRESEDDGIQELETDDELSLEDLLAKIDDGRRGVLNLTILKNCTEMDCELLMDCMPSSLSELELVAKIICKAVADVQFSLVALEDYKPVSRLAKFGDGYSSYLPSHLRDDYAPLNTGKESPANSAYEAVSWLLFGHKEKAYFLRLMTSMSALSSLNFITNKLCFETSKKTTEELATWVSLMTNSNKVSVGCRRQMVKEAITTEIIRSLDVNEEPGPLQMMFIHLYVKFPLEVDSDVTEEAYNLLRSNKTPMKLLSLPRERPSLDGLKRYVPLVRLREDEKIDRKTCGAELAGVCPTPDKECQICCMFCRQAYHGPCISWDGQTFVSCGCDKLWPLSPKREDIYLSAAQVIHRLKQIEVACPAHSDVSAVPEKVSLKTFLTNVLCMKSPSWRMSLAVSGKGSIRSNKCLSKMSYNGVLKEDAMQAVLDYLRKELPSTTTLEMIMDICVPEALICLVQQCEGLNRMEAELFLMEGACIEVTENILD